MLLDAFCFFGSFLIELHMDFLGLLSAAGADGGGLGKLASSWTAVTGAGSGGDGAWVATGVG